MSYCYLIQGKCLTMGSDISYGTQYVCELDCKPVCVTSCRPYDEMPPEHPCGAPCPPHARCHACTGAMAHEQRQAPSPCRRLRGERRPRRGGVKLPRRCVG
ncbi:uncharacterized protein LOC116840628 [Odontomachus brunneus]|uniref:uncharacterized protein LOC116840628 n=1 Tax=Odontomachus brunneus TaxID=486640 RepID=UPI0013F2648E|nr:uncharacterized protein LOC116840628 [Odontomachus brunneus]